MKSDREVVLPAPVERSADSPPAQQGFQQRLGLFDATMLVSGSMIGSGIFIVSADIARDVGSSGWLLVVWVITGLMTIIGALSYAELAALMPHAGGQYVYLREAYSPLWGFLYGWTLFLVIQTGTIAAVAVSFAKFLGVFVPRLGTDVKAGAWAIVSLDHFTITAGQVLAVFIVVALSLWNCLGVQEGKWLQNVFTVAKTLALIVLIVLGLTVAANPAAIQANLAELWAGIPQTPRYHEVAGKLASVLAAVPGWLVVGMVVGGAMVGSLFSADAWNNVTFTAGEVKNPRRTLPLSLVLGVGLVITLYLLANVAYLAVLPVEGVKNAPTVFERGIAQAADDRVATAVMEEVSPQRGAQLMAAAIMISLFGCANGLILSGARLYYVMAQDRLFFETVGRLNHHGVPAVGLIIQGLWAALLIFSGTYSDLLDYVIFAALLFYALTVGGLFVLRWTRPNAERPYRAVGYPIVPALYAVLCTVIMLDLLVVKPIYTWPGLIIVLTGIPVYYFWRARAGAR